MAKKSGKNVAKTDTQRQMCFVISPFGGWSDSYRDEIFYPAIEAANLKPLRADDIYGPSPIVDDIWTSVRKSAVLLADLTGRNPNVLYELGLAHAIRRPVVMVVQDLSDVPFDLRGLRVIAYDLQSPNWANQLRDSITQSLREVLADPARFTPATFLEPLQRDGVASVSKDEKRFLELEQKIASLQNSVIQAIAAEQLRDASFNSANVNRIMKLARLGDTGQGGWQNLVRKLSEPPDVVGSMPTGEPPPKIPDEPNKT